MSAAAICKERCRCGKPCVQYRGHVERALRDKPTGVRVPDCVKQHICQKCHGRTASNNVRYFTPGTSSLVAEFKALIRQ